MLPVLEKLEIIGLRSTLNHNDWMKKMNKQEVPAP